MRRVNGPIFPVCKILKNGAGFSSYRFKCSRLAQGLVQRLGDLSHTHLRNAAAGYYYVGKVCAQLGQIGTERLAHKPLCTVALNAVAYLFACREAYLQGIASVTAADKHAVTRRMRLSTAEHTLKIPSFFKAVTLVHFRSYEDTRKNLCYAYANKNPFGQQQIL